MRPELSSQYHTLGLLASHDHSKEMKLWLVLATLLSFGAGFITWHPWAFMLGLFFGVATVAAWRSTAHVHMQNAFQGLASDTGVEGTLTIHVDRSYSESVYYEATVFPRLMDSWKFRFHAIHWEPKDGEYAATFYYIPGVLWPVLTVTECALLFPQADPTLYPLQTDEA